jgi:hypothetical protein
MGKTKSPVKQPKPKRSRLRTFALVCGVLVVGLGALFVAMHRYPALASFIVDPIRKVVGPKPIAWAEDVVYAIQDKVNGYRRKDEAPVTYWSTPSAGSVPRPTGSVPPATSASASGSAAPAGSAPAPLVDPKWPPPTFKPPYQNVATPNDGIWVPMDDPQNPGGVTGMYKTLVHPDPKRGWAVLAVVAIDLDKVDLFSVPGTREPESPNLPRAQRPGTIPVEAQPHLLAAFNGGWQAVHGRWGMMVNGVTLLPARPIGCVIAKYKDDTFRVGVWKSLADTEPDMAFFRQTPPCLVENDRVNPATNAEETTGWGATVDGETIIRRSAFGLAADGRVAFYGMGDDLSAGSLAKAMKAAGAANVAQLDVNFSYPRFMIFDGAKDGPPKVAAPLAPTPNWKPEEYVTTPTHRDFFYLVRRTTPRSWKP